MFMKDKTNVKARMSLFNAIKESCWCFRWFHIHSFILIIRSIFKPLIMEDLINTYQGYWPQVNYSMYSKIKTMFPSYTARKIIQEMFKSNLIIASVLAIIDAGLGFAGPIIIKYILLYVNNPVQSDRQQKIAYALSGIWIGLYFIKIFVSQYWQRICAGTGVCVEVTLMSELYRKLTRVSYVYKKYISLGDFYGYLVVDISVITSMISQFSNLFGAPVTLILSVAFVCVQVGPYGLLLLLVICLAILIELYVDFMRSSIYAQKLVRFENRIAENIHMYNQFKTLRCLGWQRMLVYENIRYRVLENSLNKMYYILSQLYLFITRFSPYIIIFILFLIGFLNKEDLQWNSAVVYTVIGYITTIKSPLTTLPSVIVSLFQSAKAFDRIDNFLEADEFERVKDIYLPEGTVIVNHPILNTGTRSSINRLIVRESLYIGQHNNLINHVQNLPIQVRTHQSLDDICYEDVQKFRKCLMCLDIPYNLRYCKGERVIVLSNKSGSGKTSFLRAFLGLLNIESGYIKYAGKVGFASADDDFYLHKSIRQNVTFGEPLDPSRLQRAYELSGLYKELNKLTMYDNTIVDESNRIFAPAQKCLISLARAIYYNCDILLLDEFFQQFDIDESIEIYNLLCENLKDKLIIITSNVIHFLKPSDRILILDNCVAVQQGTLEELKGREGSKISEYYVMSPILIQEMTNMFATEFLNQAANNSIIQSLIPRKSVIMEGSMIRKDSDQNFPVLVLGQHVDSGFGSTIIETPIPRTPHPPKRYTLIELRYYWAFFRAGGFIFLFVLFIVAGACAAETFATWIIGSVANQPFGFSYGTVIVIYACLQVGYGILLLISGIFMPIVAYYNTEKLTNYFNAIIMKFKLVEMQKMSKMFLTFVVGYDYFNFYVLCDETITIFDATVSLIATVVIMGLASYLIWIIAGAILIYCIFVYLIYRRTARQIWNVCGPIRVHFYRTFEDAFKGSEVLKYYDKVEWFRLKVFDAIYMYSAVWKNNNRFAQHGFSILIGMAELILIAGIVFIGVSMKPTYTSEEAIYVSVALSAAPTLMGIITTLLNNLSDMSGNLNLFLKVPAETLRYKDEVVYDSPLPPQQWPRNGKIQLRNVMVEKPELKRPLLNNINLLIPSGQLVGVYGDYDSDITTLFLLINRLQSPGTNKEGTPCGEVYISDLNIQEFGQIYTTEHVLLLETRVVAFTGTLRYNLDPFGKYTDEELESAIKILGFWDQIDSNYENPRLMEGYGTLDFIIQQRGNQLSSSLLQKINLARAILKKPKILMIQYGLVKINAAHRELYYELMNSLLKDCTIIMLTSSLHNLFRCDRVIGIRKGKIIEDGPPRQIAAHTKSRLYKMLYLLSKSPSYEPETAKLFQNNMSTKVSYGPY